MLRSKTKTAAAPTTADRITGTAAELAQMRADLPAIEDRWQQAIVTGDDQAAAAADAERRELLATIDERQRRLPRLRELRRGEIVADLQAEARTKSAEAARILGAARDRYAAALDALQAAVDRVVQVDDAVPAHWYSVAAAAARGGVGPGDLGLPAIDDLSDRLTRELARLGELRRRFAGRHGDARVEAQQADDSLARDAARAEATEWGAVADRYRALAPPPAEQSAPAPSVAKQAPVPTRVEVDLRPPATPRRPQILDENGDVRDAPPATHRLEQVVDLSGPGATVQRVVPIDGEHDDDWRRRD